MRKMRVGFWLEGFTWFNGIREILLRLDMTALICVYILGSETQNFLHQFWEIQRFYIHRERERERERREREKEMMGSLAFVFVWCFWEKWVERWRERAKESLQLKGGWVGSKVRKRKKIKLFLWPDNLIAFCFLFFFKKNMFVFSLSLLDFWILKRKNISA